ncbi:MAG: hypothetical protein J0L99_09695 [Chitinophagales bacterium]|nr:hypothetical protein [Chitinophagales bacterium]
MSGFTDNMELRKNGFIYEATEATSESMAMLPMNRTMFIGQFTVAPPAKPKLDYDLDSPEAVFKFYEPKAKVEFQDESGNSVNETLEFKNVGQFTKKSLTENSDYLRMVNEKKAEHDAFARKLQSNKVLQKLLTDPNKKKAYITLLQALIQELESAGA